MAYQHLIAIKVKLSGLGGYRKDVMRQFKVKKNPNIDLERSQLNHFIENLLPEDLPRRVRQRIKQLHLKRKPRTDAVGLEDFTVGASVDFMLQLDEEKNEQYFADSLHFFKIATEKKMSCIVTVISTNTIPISTSVSFLLLPTVDFPLATCSIPNLSKNFKLTSIAKSFNLTDLNEVNTILATISNLINSNSKKLNKKFKNSPKT